MKTNNGKKSSITGAVASEAKFEETSYRGLSYYISALILLVYGYYIIAVTSEGIRFFGKIISDWGSGAYDANGPKFLFLSVWNIIAFVLLYFLKEFRKDRSIFLKFFINRIGIAYALMMFFALLSFCKAINTGEAFIHFCKIFTGFTAAWIISVIIFKFPKLITVLALSLTLLLLIDAVGVFIETYKGASVYAIKLGYSNKNILTSALFVKIPFALWLMFFSKSWRKVLGVLGVASGVLSILYMNTRAFYLGTVITFLLVVIYAVCFYISHKDKRVLKGLVTYALTLVCAFSVYAFTSYVKSLKEEIEKTVRTEQVVQNDNKVQQLPSDNKKVETAALSKFWKQFSDRVKSIADTKQDKSNTQRLDAWRWSLNMIAKEPLLGVGAGNWKVRVLEYENQKTPDFVYMYKNHNDFLEVPAEIGLLGGVCFLLIFIFVYYYCIKSVFYKQNPSVQKMFFLPAFGLFAYSLDAFFNFPQDRPEILTLFSIYVGIAVGVALIYLGREKFLQKISSPISVKIEKGAKYLLVILVGLSVLSVYILDLNYKSLYAQRLVAAEKLFDKYNRSAVEIEKMFPSIPTISAIAEPISVEKALYYIREKNYKKALDILHKDGGRYSPWDGRVNYYLGATFYQYEKDKPYDSIVYYMRKTLKLKPKFYQAVSLLQDALIQTGRTSEAIEELKNYIDRYKYEPKAWNQLAKIYENQRMHDELLSLMDSAQVYVAHDKDVQQNIAVVNALYRNDYTADYNKAVEFYSNGNYKDAEVLFTSVIEKVPNFADAYALRAICNYHLKRYAEAVSDFDQQEKLGKSLIAETMNVRAASYYMLNNLEKAKKYFKQAMQNGDQTAKDNYQKLFGNTE